MAKTTFAKVALTPEKLLAKLQAQGLVVPAADKPLAENYFRYIGGYRLKGYWHQVVDPATKQFPQGYTFRQLADRVDFDRGLRTSTSQAIEVLELAIRSVINNALSVHHGAHWFLDHRIFKPNGSWGLGKLIRKIEDEVERSKQRPAVDHYFKNHDDPYLPPSWSITECVTFGLWSQTYKILRDPNDRKVISKKFNVDTTEVFDSWLHTLSVIRNAVAHHSQLLGTKLRVKPTNYKAGNIDFLDNQTFYAVALLTNYLLTHTGMPQTWKADLRALFARYQSIQPSDLGFPGNWETRPGW